MIESNIAVANRIRAQLVKRWPVLFNERKPVPLAIGINEALLDAMPEITADQLRRALAPWCKRPRYLAALTAGADRHGLESIQGIVTEEQAAGAAERFRAIQALFREKQEAKRKAEQARQAEAKERAEKLEVKKSKQAESPPIQPKQAPATPKPAGPVIMVKKRRLAQPGS